MTSMTNIEQPTPEPTVVLKSPEPEHSTPIVVLYRGGTEDEPTNPYMKAIADGLKQRGLNVIDRPIPPDVFRSKVAGFNRDFANKEETRNPDFQNKSGVFKDMMEAVGEIPEGSLIVSDYTVGATAKFLSPDTISAYAPLKEIRHDVNTIEGTELMVKPLIEAIRSGGKVPTMFLWRIGDHGISPTPEEDEAEKNSPTENKIYAQRLAHKRGASNYIHVMNALNVPIITEKEFEIGGDIDYPDVAGDISETLDKLSIPMNNAVLLLDHHATYMSRDQVRHSQLDKIEVAMVCSCCIGMSADSLMPQAEKDKHFKPYPIQPVENFMDPVIDILVSQIQERQAIRQAAK